MLHFETIESSTLRLLKKLQKIEEFASMRLVGGTALALHIGHRKSIDLDLFGILESPYEDFMDSLREIGSVEIIKNTKNIHLLLIDGIKVDVVNYSYPWLKDEIVTDDIRICTIEDIAAMKINAITGRGTRKDFIDLYFLLQHFSMKEIIEFYLEKYYDGSEFMALKSLTYFTDAEEEEMPIMLKDISWDEMKTEIEKQVKFY